MKLCVIFDIDETLIHFIDEINYHVWENTSAKDKKRLTYKEENRQVYIFRPFLREMFSFFMKNRSTISVGLWTFADAKYAAKVGEEIVKFCNLPKDFFLFIYSIDDISGPYPKDLRHVYSNFPECNKSNTLLVDNLASNINHKINKNNGIVIPAFAPYGFNPTPDPSLNGADEIRNTATSLEHKKAQRDVCLRDIIQIFKVKVKDKGGSQNQKTRKRRRRSLVQMSFKKRYKACSR